MVRRVVTGEKDGKSVFLSDGPVANTHNYAAVPGFQTTLAWATMQDIEIGRASCRERVCAIV